MSKFWVLTVPWNLSFQAHALIHEIRTSRARGIAVPAEREPEARRIAVRMRWFAIGAHLVSAGIVALITFVSGGAIGYYLAALYLVSTFFRPAGAYFAYLRDRMTSMLRDVKHPRDKALHAKVDAHARQFEHSLTRLTDNQEVIAGLKAFLRLVRDEPA